MTEGRLLACSFCHEQEVGHVQCPQGHYVCESCHGAPSRDAIREALKRASGTDPVRVAKQVLDACGLPMLGCEHAAVAAGALMVALQEEGILPISRTQKVEALRRTQRQAVGAYCGLTGVCGVTVAMGACVSVLTKAACPKAQGTTEVMRVVSRVADVLADEAGPCCCKRFLYRALAETARCLNDWLGTSLDVDARVVCYDGRYHPHGCPGESCAYSAKRSIERIST